MRAVSDGTRVLLNGLAIGILLFLVWDVFSAAWAPIDAALGSAHDGHGGVAKAIGFGLLFAAGLGVGLLSLVFYERWMKQRAGRAFAAAHAGESGHSGHSDHRGHRPHGPGAAAASELARPINVAQTAAGQLALLIAVGIGLHNFAEGLAIGQSAASGDISLAVMLVIGFALHNATEGFGIVGPITGQKGADGASMRPTWGFLAMLGLIGGGPTVVGTLIGHQFSSAALSVIFLTLAAGSITYVIIQLLGVASRAKKPEMLAVGIFLGLLAGFITDAIVTLGGV
jgi:ZIP family zinc transporter